ncbi:hypothetical protein ACFLSI_05920 [Bacteroidota bacterium]
MLSKLIKKIEIVLLTIFFIIPATGVSISKHSCIDCGEYYISLIHHHHENDNESCCREESYKDGCSDFFEKHKQHKKECNCEIIKIKIPYCESKTISESSPLEFFRFFEFSKYLIIISESSLNNIVVKENIKIPNKNIIRDICISTT